MSVRVLGLDVSTCTGYGFWDYSRDVSSIEAGVIELPEAKSYYEKGRRKQDYHWDDWRVAQVGPKIIKLIRIFKPEFVLVEERLRFSKTGDGGFAMTNAIHGAIYAHCCSLNILYGTIPVQSWRHAAYGEGYEPPLVPALGKNRQQKIDEKTGKPLFKSKDWGDIAVDKCEELHIQLPKGSDVAHNAAEAAIIAMMWRCHKRISIPETRALDRYVKLLERPRTPREVAA